jgi:hypothetical protein
VGEGEASDGAGLGVSLGVGAVGSAVAPGEAVALSPGVGALDTTTADEADGDGLAEAVAVEMPSTRPASVSTCSTWVCTCCTACHSCAVSRPCRLSSEPSAG